MGAERVKVVLDGRTVEVERGTTVLEAARQAGIRIPTLCHVDGLEPAASCFLCCVQIEGRRELSPSCAMPVDDGMTVTTNSDDVRTSRRMALELLLSDHAGDCIAPCAARCPAELDIPGFLYPLAAGDPAESIEVLWRRLPLAGSLGRVCPRLCEQHCRRMHHDDGLAIGKLHRWVADREGGPKVPAEGDRAPASGRSVGIIGAGPAGLSAAYFLLREGHAVTLYDAHHQPGGMLRYGIPAYRLPKKPLDREIEVVRGLGAEFQMGQCWGRDFHLEDLLGRHDAVFVAIGAQRSMKLRCAGDDMALDAVDLLAAVARDETPELGRRVIVVGGGNTAMDAARSARRLGAEVKVVYRRTEREMPCLLEEVEGAREEGVEIDFLVAPARVERSASGETTLVCQHMELGEPDESGRRRPEPIPDRETSYPCDSVVAAVGQSVAIDLAANEGLKTTKWGIAADSQTLETNLPGVFAGGDAVLGADLAVRAIAAGRLAAASIDQHLSGTEIVGLKQMVNVFFQPLDDEELAEVFRDIERQTQIATPHLPPGERLDSFAEIDAGLSAETAVDEARRCMSCGCTAAVGCGVRQYATEYGADPTRYLGVRRRFDRDESHPEIVYEPGKCILCDACVRIARQATEPLGVALIGRGFQVAMGVPFERPLSEGLSEVAERCAEACPTGALSLRRMRSCDLGGCGGGGSGGAGDRLVTLGKGRR
jgi:formate dehydrogenase major subunit